MSSCCVVGCSNNSKKKMSDRPWLSFHAFPKDKETRDYWIASLGECNIKPVKTPAVCSDHFKEDDFLHAFVQGIRPRLKPEARPVFKCDDLNDRCPRMRLCRICLAIDRKTYYMGSYIGLEDMYTSITGRRVFSLNKVPSQLCWECAARLTTAANFREKAIMSDKILESYFEKNKNKHITAQDVRKMCNNTKLKSSFVIDRIFDSIDGKDSMPGKVKTDINLPNNKVKPVKNEIEIDTTLRFDNFGPNTVITEIDDDVKIEILKDVTSVSDDECNEIEGTYAQEKNKKINTAKGKIILTPLDVYEHKYQYSRPIDETLYTVKHLTEEQELINLQNRKHSLQYINSPFKCEICFKGFLTHDMLERHAIKHTEKNGPHVCRICKIRSQTKAKARMHMERHHSYEISCNQCPFKTRLRNLVWKHMKFHDGQTYECSHCGYIFKKQTSYLSHLRLKHISDFVCNLCGYTFVSPHGVFVHKTAKHPLISKDVKLEGPHCEICDVKFLTQAAYDTHLKISSKHVTEDDPNRISNDPAVKNVPPIYVRNANPRPQHRQVSCEQCGEVLPNFHTYVKHFNKFHPGLNRSKCSPRGMPYLCEQCGKVYTNHTYLVHHKAVAHEGGKRFQCSICEKTFTFRSNLTNHMKLHDATRLTNDCRVCGKRFYSTSNLKRHLLIHAGLKPFKCQACEKTFTQQAELKSHFDYIHLLKRRPKRVRSRIKVPEVAAEICVY